MVRSILGRVSTRTVMRTKDLAHRYRTSIDYSTRASITVTFRSDDSSSGAVTLLDI